MSHAEQLHQSTQSGQSLTRQPADDLLIQLTEYAHQRPDVIALWAFGLGFLVGVRFRWW